MKNEFAPPGVAGLRSTLRAGQPSRSLDQPAGIHGDLSQTVDVNYSAAYNEKSLPGGRLLRESVGPLHSGARHRLGEDCCGNSSCMMHCIQHGLWVLGCHLQQHHGWAFGHAPALFPIP